MEVKAVSALRVKRGLRRVSGAEPQVVGLMPQTTEERKTDTMKTYILRNPKPVQPQKLIRPPRSKPAAPAPRKDPVLFLGLDVHNDSIAVSLAPSDSAAVRRYGIIGGEHEDVLKLAKKLAEAHQLLSLGGIAALRPDKWAPLLSPKSVRVLIEICFTLFYSGQELHI
jgi:hypothetical protein